MFMYASFGTVKALPDFLNAVTGWDTTVDELLMTGERISNLRQAFNIREGLDLLKFQVPGRVIGNPPQKEGPLNGVSVVVDEMLKEYLTAMDWDAVNAKPNKQKLLELGLDNVARELWP